MNKYAKRRRVLTIVCISLSAAIFLAIVAFWLSDLLKGDYDDLQTALFGLIAGTVIIVLPLELALWDSYVSLRYFLGDPRMRTGFFTFVNIFAIFTAFVTVFEIVNMVFNPFGISWMGMWYTMPDPLEWFMGACSMVRFADVLLRFIYLLSYRRFKKSVSAVCDEGAHRITDLLERPPLT